ncbi:2-dehydropantoate 2-reductase [Sporosarcina sp. ACRSM]|uniref:2-dehydropantoate 2-reductase n=1 Tax=Sporosarcina sp. ACRSM TaxID=2918216 RepID=UPI001EF436C5|nr:2-dehydropantoate 2-reductase [Sporosarcina sp. ACRSM]MCG7334156.1 2-dehydropantoate 2-reductase [Sporosarcina sp. ACRSM]
MNVVVAGAGSIGLLIGSYLAEAGMDVTFYVRREEQAQLIQTEGIRRIQQDGTKKVFCAQATTDIHRLPVAPWIVAVKFSGVEELLMTMQQAEVNPPVLFVQNGIGHLELVERSSLQHVAFATVEHGAGRRDDRTFSHNGVGNLTRAVFRGDEKLFDFLGHADAEHFPVVYHLDAEQILMRKVLINCMINPLTAILQVKNGELLKNPCCLTMFNRLYEELMDAFPEMRQVLPYEAVTGVCEKTTDNRSSMLVDHLAGRPMEINTIVSAIRVRAEKRNKTLPILTALEMILYAMDWKGAGEWRD